MGLAATVVRYSLTGMYSALIPIHTYCLFTFGIMVLLG